MSSIDPTAISRPRSPDIISGYHLDKLVGSGGMGEVHKATQLSLGRTVAVKLLNPELAKDPSFIARFQKEAAALAALSHPHIVSIVDKGKTDTTYYLVMEFVDGPSLRELIREPQLDVMGALRRMLQICRAIEYAHGRGVIHRDLKPENILLDQQAGGIAKVSDFGLASFLEDASPSSRYALTSTHVSMGTLSYMAPEQRVDAKSADARGHLLAGRHPLRVAHGRGAAGHVRPAVTAQAGAGLAAGRHRHAVPQAGPGGPLPLRHHAHRRPGAARPGQPAVPGAGEADAPPARPPGRAQGGAHDPAGRGRPAGGGGAGRAGPGVAAQRGEARAAAARRRAERGPGPAIAPVHARPAGDRLREAHGVGGSRPGCAVAPGRRTAGGGGREGHHLPARGGALAVARGPCPRGRGGAGRRHRRAQRPRACGRAAGHLEAPRLRHALRAVAAGPLGRAAATRQHGPLRGAHP
ncbi:protein kinase domain-containing protein [Myxococcus sp. MxC21-1]|uniref:protein kinase domain-containing protein n=1 Tax=Myxococcus sp. MxC21-1 TaxID=3041439 RepID=UPI0039775725